MPKVRHIRRGFNLKIEEEEKKKREVEAFGDKGLCSRGKWFDRFVENFSQMSGRDRAGRSQKQKSRTHLMYKSVLLLL